MKNKFLQEPTKENKKAWKKAESEFNSILEVVRSKGSYNKNKG